MTMCFPKYFVFIFNLLVCILGIAILGIGVGLLFFVESKLGTHNFDIFFYPLIAIGCVAAVISFFGCCGAITENRCMIMTFSIFTLIMLAIQIGIGVYGYQELNKLDSFVDDFLMETLKAVKTNPSLLQVWSMIQQFFECCGVNSSDDWSQVPNGIPMSCCPIPNANVTMAIDDQITCHKEDAFGKGCKKLVTDYLGDMTRPVMYGVIGFIVIQAINLTFSCCMFWVYCLSRSDKEDHDSSRYDEPHNIDGYERPENQSKAD